MRSERGGLLGGEEGKPDGGGAWRSGTAFYRPPPRSHTTATSEAALDDGTLIEDIEVDADNKVVSTEPMEPLDPHIKYQHLSQIERALRMLSVRIGCAWPSLPEVILTLLLRLEWV